MAQSVNWKIHFDFLDSLLFQVVGEEKHQQRRKISVRSTLNFLYSE